MTHHKNTPLCKNARSCYGMIIIAGLLIAGAATYHLTSKAVQNWIPATAKPVGTSHSIEVPPVAAQNLPLPVQGAPVAPTIVSSFPLRS